MSSSERGGVAMKAYILLVVVVLLAALLGGWSDGGFNF
jgi:hypothetical protein